MGSARTVVFVCQHGAAKSVLAAALLERLAGEHGIPLRALTRGTEPEPQVAPAVAGGLLAEGIDVRAWRPRPLTPGDLAQGWRVVSFDPDLSQLVPSGTVLEVRDDVPAVADGLEGAQAAITGRLLRLIRTTPTTEGLSVGRRNDPSASYGGFKRVTYRRGPVRSAE